MTTSNSTADQIRLIHNMRQNYEKSVSKRYPNSLAKRHRKEKMFRFFGFSAVIAGLLVCRATFWQYL
jgi:phosphate transport system permease protein